ncbi:MAG: hypothetical protein ACXQTY_02060 [Candidatus Methanogasteraceae archaeon]
MSIAYKTMKVELEKDMDNTLTAKSIYDEQYVSEWHEGMQSACMIGTFMPDCIEGIS